MAISMHGDIITDHRERMLNLKKYYPFFRLIETNLGQFADGSLECLDMGYIVMAILRFFIEENSFKEKEVLYSEYLDFIKGVFARDFGLKLSEEEEKAAADYIFDKLKNDGKPFDFQYFDPIDKKKRVSRVKVLESNIRNNTVWYSISSDAIEFYLDTKEIKDESRISVQQLLLEKMIRSQNFLGGTEVVARINEEVSRLWVKKNQVMETIAADVYSGIEAYEDFVDTGMKWFEDEEKLFNKNRELIATALERLERNKEESDSYYRTAKEIYELDNQLKVAMNKHSELLRACMELQKLTDEAIVKAKLGKLRNHTDFRGMLESMIKTDCADIMADMMSSLFMPNIAKTFNLTYLDSSLENKPKTYQEVERVSSETPKEIVFADELEEQRIRHNYVFIMNNLIMALRQKSSFTLSEFTAAMKKLYSEDIVHNGDYYSFFVNLCQKKEYRIGGAGLEEESFLDSYVKDAFNDCELIEFTISLNSDEQLELFEDCVMSDVGFALK